MPGECNGCGACCRTIMLEQSPDEVRQMATLTRVLGIPSDHQFAAEHWRPLAREEALAANPFYVSRERPLVCRGYPWYGAEPKRMPLADPECGYAVDVPPE